MARRPSPALAPPHFPVWRTFFASGGGTPHTFLLLWFAMNYPDLVSQTDFTTRSRIGRFSERFVYSLADL